MELLSPTDSIFLIGESREHPMHVGGLQLFDPPEGAPEDFVHDLYEKVAALSDFSPMFRKRPATLLGGIANVGWALGVFVVTADRIVRGRVCDLDVRAGGLCRGLADRGIAT